MRSSFAKAIAAVVLVVGITVAPITSAAPVREAEGPSFKEEIIRIVRVIRDAAKKTFGGASSNADSLTTPRP